MKNVLEQATISMDVKAARVKVAEYVRAVRERHNAEDLAILRGYRALAKGHLPEAEYPLNQFGWGLWGGRQRAMVPHVPPALRPIHSLDGYATLFEVEEWAPDPTAPADPALLKHIGGDLYAVLAVWDLSELERSVLNGRTR
jgi:hypothetical protein